MPNTISPDDDATALQPLIWDHETEQVPASGLGVKRAATDAERAALATALGILSCDALQVSYRLSRAPDEGYRLKGKLTADVVQACVVTLAAVHDTVSADFVVEFRPEEEVRRAEGGAVDLEEDTEIEPIDGTVMAVGRVVFEELAAALNPYPRRPGAEFAAPAVDPKEAEAIAKEHPFAVLAKLKQPK